MPPTLQAPPTSTSPRSVGRRPALRATAAVGLLAGSLLLSACAVPDVASMSPKLPTKPSAAATAAPAVAPTGAATGATAGTPTGATTTGVPAAVPTAVPTPTTPVDHGDLGRGSATHQLAAGDRTLVVDYWTAADPTTLSARTPIALQLSAHLEDGDTEHAVKVSRFLATTDDGTTLATLTDDRGEFVITPPFSYGTALTIRCANQAATSVTVSIQFDLLVETAPGSGAFFRQTVLDNLRIALPGTGTATAPSPSTGTAQPVTVTTRS